MTVISCLPGWAQKTLAEHAADQREQIYDLNSLAAGETHDPYWNAAMAEMRHTGFMHNYMRMYWGKKILEWTPSPEQAFDTALALNNKYFIDGRDPNSFAGVGWVFGLHDRAWFERDIFGKVRYMAASGLERKCDINALRRKNSCLEQQSCGRIDFPFAFRKSRSLDFRYHQVERSLTAGSAIAVIRS
jgi:deoxyribodipyrimidine photo-lyase